MKRFYKFLAMAIIGVVALGVSSCDNVNMFDQMVTPSTIDVPASIEAPAPIRVAVTAGHDWFVQSTCDWITVSNITSTGFTINIEKYEGEGVDTRSGIVLVSSQTGQWPVVVNQDRRLYSTIEEWIGTYRVQYNEYTLSATGVLSATGNSFDFLTISEDLSAAFTGGSLFVGLDNVIPYENDNWGINARLMLEFLPDENRMILSPAFVDGFNATYFYWDTENAWDEYIYQTYVDIDPVTKQMVFDGIDEYDTTWFGLSYLYFGILPIFYGDFAYNDLIITQVEQTVAPAPAPAPYSFETTVIYKEQERASRDQISIDRKMK